MTTSLPPASSAPSPISFWLRTAGDAVTLKPEPYQRLAAKPSLRTALLIILVVGLIIGAAQALIDIPGLFRSPQAEVERGLAAFEQGLNQVLSMSGQLSTEAQEIIDRIKGGSEAWKPYVTELVAVPAPLPSVFGRFFTWIGAWLSSPFSLMASWLAISIWIMLFARLLGGRGGVVSYLAASSLSVIPHLLSIFSFVPCLGGFLALVGGIWGLMVQYKAVQVSHGLSQGRSILAVLLPYIILAVILTFLATIFAILLGSAISSMSAGGN